MNSYNDAYNKSRHDAKVHNLKIYEEQRIDLVNAIKKEYCISDLSTLSEGKKQAVRNLITEMWSPKTGLNKKGEDFIQNGNIPLNESSDSSQIKRDYVKKVNVLLDNKFAVNPLFNKSDARNLAEIKEDIENKIGRKLDAKTECRLWFYDAVCAYVNKHLKDIFTK